MDKALKQQILETIEETYITELRNKYTGLMGVKTIYLVHYLMRKYGKFTEMDLNKNQNRFNKTLYTTIQT